MGNIKIPDALKKPNLRFCLITKGLKASFQDHTKLNYKFDDPILLKHLEENGNYGIMGINNILVLDIDNINILDKLEFLPKTFTYTSATKKLPIMVFSTSDQKPTNNFYGCFDLRGKGSYQVGPNSRLIKTYRHNEGVYTNGNDLPIAFLSDENYNKLLQIGEKNKQVKPKISENKIINNENSYYYEKNLFPLNTPFPARIVKVLRLSKNKITYELLTEIPSEIRDQYKIPRSQQTLDFNTTQLLKILKVALPNINFYMCPRDYLKNGKKQRYWSIVDNKKINRGVDSQ